MLKFNTCRPWNLYDVNLKGDQREPAPLNICRCFLSNHVKMWDYVQQAWDLMCFVWYCRKTEKREGGYFVSKLIGLILIINWMILIVKYRSYLLTSMSSIFSEVPWTFRRDFWFCSFSTWKPDILFATDCF